MNPAIFSNQLLIHRKRDGLRDIINFQLFEQLASIRLDRIGRLGYPVSDLLDRIALR